LSSNSTVEKRKRLLFNSDIISLGSSPFDTFFAKKTILIKSTGLTKSLNGINLLEQIYRLTKLRKSEL
jgi:hypothetical protein